MLSLFDVSAAAVAAWLRQTGVRVRSLSLETLSSDHRSRGLVRGWAFPVDVNGQRHEMRLLLTAAFPYDRARSAIVDPVPYASIAHVEQDGIVCGPPYVYAAEDPVENAKTAIAGAFHLLEETSAFHHAEFQNEFVSYWGKGRISQRFVSLFDPVGDARHLVTWTQGSHVFAAESADDLFRWLSNGGRPVKRTDFGTGVFLLATTAPAPPPPLPFEKAPFFAWLDEVASRTSKAVLSEATAANNHLTILVAADIDGRRGLIGAALAFNGPLKGFREGRLSMKSLRMYGTLAAATVKRSDAPWIHGRDTNPHVATFASATVTILGCGALGSHVAVRLAQAGVGSFRLFDPENLDTANIGRHALGMGSVDGNKASALAEHLRSRFPHVKRIDAIESRWEQMARPGDVFESDVIVCTIGEAGPELLLNELHVRRGGKPPVVYGWMEARAAAAHAIAIIEPTHCLRCFIDGDGQPLMPETEWSMNTGDLMSEPACGTFFQPFGPVEVARAEALVSDTVIDVIRGKLKTNVHRVYATTNDRLRELAGHWSGAHLSIRPQGWAGGLEFERTLPAPKDCKSALH